jgi:hypothetical protein
VPGRAGPGRAGIFDHRAPPFWPGNECPAGPGRAGQAGHDYCVKIPLGYTDPQVMLSGI